MNCELQVEKCVESCELKNVSRKLRVEKCESQVAS